MPPVSNAQAKAMYAAASGKSTLGIPKKVGEEYTEPVDNASEDKQEVGLSPEEQAQQGHRAKGKTHRGRRSKGKGAKQHHTEAKAHVAKAQAAPTPAAALPHLFKAVRAMHAAKEAAAIADLTPDSL